MNKTLQPLVTLALITIIAILLSGCASDGVKFQPQNFGAITSDVQTASATIKMAKTTATDVYNNGVAAKSPVILQLQSNLTNIQNALDKALNIDIPALKTDDAKQIALANKVQAESAEKDKIIASDKKALANLALFVVIALWVGAMTWQFAPVIKTGLSLYPPVAAFLALIPALVFQVGLLVVEGILFYFFDTLWRSLGWLFRLIF